MTPDPVRCEQLSDQVIGHFSRGSSTQVGLNLVAHRDVSYSFPKCPLLEEIQNVAADFVGVPRDVLLLVGVHGRRQGRTRPGYVRQLRSPFLTSAGATVTESGVNSRCFRTISGGRLVKIVVTDDVAQARGRRGDRARRRRGFVGAVIYPRK